MSKELSKEARDIQGQALSLERIRYQNSFGGTYVGISDDGCWVELDGSFDIDTLTEITDFAKKIKTEHKKIYGSSSTDESILRL